MVDHVLSMRTRAATSPLAYCAHLQAFLASDEFDGLQLLPLRRLFNSTKLCRLLAPMTSVVTSTVHSSVLMGSADGTVCCTNPVRRLFSAKSKNSFMQRWFVHDWRPNQQEKGREEAQQRLQKTDKERNSAIQAGQQPVVTDHTSRRGEKPCPNDGSPRPGVVRITEGYKVESLSENWTKRGGADALRSITTHEEESAVTCLEWNPNIDCGGWAAAGMGSGLLRIEDVAI